MAFTERKFAYKQLIKDEQGDYGVTFVDAKSGQPVVDPSMYTIVDPQFLEKEEEEKQLKKKRPNNDGGETTEYTGGRPDSERVASNNYGYIDKPDWMGPAAAGAGFIGGPFLGAALGIADKGINAENTAAVNKARDMLGMPERGFMDNARSVIGGNNSGYIGDIAYGGKNTPVGFEAQDSTGRTTLTPNEARQRELLAGAIPTVDVKQSNAPKSGGLLGGVRENMKSLTSNIFGPVVDPIKSAVKEVTQPIKDSVKENITNPIRENTSQPIRGAVEGIKENVRDVVNPDRQKEVDKPMPSYEQAMTKVDQPIDLTDIQQATNPVMAGDLQQREMSRMEVSLSGATRSEMPTSGIVDQVRTTATDVLGPDYTVELHSGKEPLGVGPVGSDRHPQGFAGDFRVYDPAGQLVTAVDPRMSDLAVGAAAQFGANVGYGKEYMGNKSIHIDNMPQSMFSKGQAPQWASAAIRDQELLNDARTFGTMPASYYDRATANPPTPEPAPRGYVDPMTSVREFTPDDKDLMGRTLAGEIDTRKTDLSTPEGRMEAMGILSTIENRSEKYGGIQGAITAPNQYSTWNTPQTAATANKNYASNKELFDTLVEEFATNPTNNLGFTNYYNPEVANPAWGNQMLDTVQLGPHTFGSLKEQQPTAGFISAPSTPQQAINQTASLGWSTQASQSLTGFAPDMKDTTEQDEGSKGSENSSPEMSSSDTGNSGGSDSSSDGVGSQAASTDSTDSNNDNDNT